MKDNSENIKKLTARTPHYKNIVNLWDDYFNDAKIPSSEFCSQNKEWSVGESKESNERNKKNREHLKTYSDDEVTYNFNSYGFRSKEFNDVEDQDDNKLNILFGGCSITEGQCLPESVMWPTLFVNQLEQKFGIDAQQYNVSGSGFSCEKITRNIYTTVSKGLVNPDVVLVLMPPIFRSEAINYTNSNRLLTRSLMPGRSSFSPDVFGRIEKSYLENTHYKQRFTDFFKECLLLKFFLQSKGVKFYFMSWDNMTYKTEAINEEFTFAEIMKTQCPTDLLDHYIDAKMFFTDHDLIDHGGPIVFAEQIARDYRHPGPNCNLFFANSVLDSLSKKDEFLELVEKFKK